MPHLTPSTFPRRSVQLAPWMLHRSNRCRLTYSPFKDVAMNAFQAAAGFPFADADLSKAWAFFRLPTLRVDRLLEAHRKNTVALTNANQVAFEGLATLAQRQSDLVTTTVDEYREVVSAVLATPSVEDQAKKQADGVRYILESSAARFPELFDVVTKANVATVDILSARITEALDKLRALFAAPAEPMPATGGVPTPVVAEPVAEAEKSRPATRRTRRSSPPPKLKKARPATRWKRRLSPRLPSSPHLRRRRADPPDAPVHGVRVGLRSSGPHAFCAFMKRARRAWSCVRQRSSFRPRR
jgi:phasin family protein